MFNEFSPLKTVALRHPREAFSSHTSSCDIWEKLDWLDRPDIEAAQAEFDVFADLLRQAGAEVITYVGREISAKGCGGPTCLTRPLKREFEL